MATVIRTSRAGKESGCEEGSDAIRVGYWFDSAGTSAFAGCGYAAMKTLGSYVPKVAVSSRSKAVPYSITSSARAISVGGNSRSSAFAVLRLITSSYLVGACTGRSAGFSPLRMRST
jgi:hypothetical protein